MAGCSLNTSPRENWVDQEGGLPDYICRVARALIRGGKARDTAIAIAVSRIKVWAAGKGVDKDTQAKASAALAQWEKMKSSAKARPNKAKLSNTTEEEPTYYETDDLYDDFDDSIFRFYGDEVLIRITLSEAVRVRKEDSVLDKFVALAGQNKLTAVDRLVALARLQEKEKD